MVLLSIARLRCYAECGVFVFAIRCGTLLGVRILSTHGNAPVLEKSHCMHCSAYLMYSYSTGTSAARYHRLLVSYLYHISYFNAPAGTPASPRTFINPRIINPRISLFCAPAAPEAAGKVFHAVQAQSLCRGVIDFLSIGKRMSPQGRLNTELQYGLSDAYVCIPRRST